MKGRYFLSILILLLGLILCSGCTSAPGESVLPGKSNASAIALVTPETPGISTNMETQSENISVSVIYDKRIPRIVAEKIGTDPDKIDTDRDGLTDYFEYVVMEQRSDPLITDTNGNGITDAHEDPDSDRITNIEEQKQGTHPFASEFLSYRGEMEWASAGAAKDSDGDKLIDISEHRLGTDSINPDSNGNGIPDGEEFYQSSGTFRDGLVSLSVIGKGEAVQRVVVSRANYSALIPDTILISDVFPITFDDTVREVTFKLRYNASRVKNPSALSMFVMNETSGSFDTIPFTVNVTESTISTTVTQSGEYTIMDKAKWDARFHQGPR